MPYYDSFAGAGEPAAARAGIAMSPDFAYAITMLLSRHKL